MKNTRDTVITVTPVSYIERVKFKLFLTSDIVQVTILF